MLRIVHLVHSSGLNGYSRYCKTPISGLRMEAVSSRVVRTQIRCVAFGTVCGTDDGKGKRVTVAYPKDADKLFDVILTDLSGS